jgi:predicted methyltransferase
MTRDELVEAVMRQRLVKKNTVHLALTNKALFQRLPGGEFTLASHPSTETN